MTADPPDETAAAAPGAAPTSRPEPWIEGEPTRGSGSRPDAVAASAVDLARTAAVEVGGADVGVHLGATVEADRVVTHAFEATLAGYRGWYWAVTVARASRSRVPTVDEVVLLPGPQALRPPPWVPWSQRLRAGDLGAGDLLPAATDDPRLVPAFWSVDDWAPDGSAATVSAGDASATTLSARDIPATDDAAPDISAADDAVSDDAPDPFDADAAAAASLRQIGDQLGLGRARVLSRDGRLDAAERWFAGDGGPDSPVARQAPGRCGTCGFMVSVSGSLRAAFGVCANEYSSADGRVVSVEFGCGAHSEAVLDVASRAALTGQVYDSAEMVVEPM